MSTIALGGALGLGTLIGWFVYYINRYRKGDVQLSDLTTLVGVIGGGLTTYLFDKSAAVFGAYGIGLALGFFAYFFVLIFLVRKSDNFTSDWFLDGRRKDPEAPFAIPPDVRPTVAPMATRPPQSLVAETAAAGIPGTNAKMLAPTPGDDDPASPREGELSETADLATARVLANLGGQDSADIASIAAATAAEAAPVLSFDLGHAKAFLEACETSKPRVTYGLGAKVPFFGAVPGRDFTRVDCSGFVREAIRRATTPPLPFPDGSVNQHDWVRAHGLEKISVAASLHDDGGVRIAFLRPQDTSSHIGHVVLIAGGQTLESHGGTGPDSRTWDGLNWQSKTFVYIFAPAQQTGAAKLSELARQARVFTVHHGRRYRASITLSGLERLAGNARIQQMLESYGFTSVSVTGSGSIRVAEAVWSGADTTAPLDPHLTDVIELPAAGGAPAKAARSRRR